MGGVGTAEGLHDTRGTRVVAGFIGDTNLLSGRALAVSDGICEVETAAGRIKASVRQQFAAGGPVVVAVRPERLVLTSLQEGGTGLSGSITDVIFLGTSRTYVVRLFDRTECGGRRRVHAPPF